MSNARSQKAKEFLRRVVPVAPDATLESIHGAPALEMAMPPPEAIPDEHRGTVESAARKSMTNEPLTPDEQFALEAIIIPDKRPAVDVVNGDFAVTHPLWTKFSTDAAIHARLKNALPSIGRIELPTNPSVPYGGTGFVVGKDLLMTNRHVAEIFASGLGVRTLAFRPGSAAVDFKREKGSPDSSPIAVRDVIMIHPYWDMALLRVDGLNGHPPLVLSLVHPEDAVRREIAVVGYPAFDPRNDAAVQNQVFGGVYYIKRLQPGLIGRRRSIQSFENQVSATTHDSSTLGGNSGSAVIDATTGHVIALHFAGLYLDANFGVPTSELARDGRVIDTGINFAPRARAEPGVWADAWQRADEEERPQPRPDETDGGQPQQAGNAATWRIPIEITIRVGAAAQVPVVAATTRVAEVTEKMVEPVHDEDYSNREGYQPDFLGVSVPLPDVTDLSLVARTDRGEYILPYNHFSVVMNKRRRLALFTASNLDYSKKNKQPDPSKNYSRKVLGGLGDRDMEKWFTDPRIEESEQLPDRFFTKDKGAFDKGHIVRREDVAWGKSYDEVQLANGDTFHVTNCSPQVAGFNRPEQGDNWGDLEQFVARDAKTEQLSLFAGPVLSDDDQTFVGVDDEGPVRVKIPSRFWKVVVAVEGDELRSFGFLLEQDLSDVPLEFIVDQTWARHMVPIPELEQLLGVVRFPDVVRHADQSGTAHGEAVRQWAGIKMKIDRKDRTR
jgi:DNA/RNA endonuclease G (NUC1)